MKLFEKKNIWNLKVDSSPSANILLKRDGIQGIQKHQKKFNFVCGMWKPYISQISPLWRGMIATKTMNVLQNFLMIISDYFQMHLRNLQFLRRFIHNLLFHLHVDLFEKSARNQGDGPGWTLSQLRFRRGRARSSGGRTVSVSSCQQSINGNPA